MELSTAVPPRINRIPELVEFCRATQRDSSYVVPPTMNITTSCGLCHHKLCTSCNKSSLKKEKTSVTHIPSLLKMISNKGVIHITQSPSGYALHRLKQKWLMLSVHILNPLFLFFPANQQHDIYLGRCTMFLEKCNLRYRP